MSHFASFWGLKRRSHQPAEPAAKLVFGSGKNSFEEVEPDRPARYNARKTYLTTR